MFTLSKNEYDIVSLLWKEKRALSRTEIIDLSTEKQWKPSSIHILLNSLLNKGAIKVDGFTQTKKNFGRTYAAALSAEEYAAMQFTKNIAGEGESKENIFKMFSALVYMDGVDQDMLDEMQRILDERRGKSGN